MTRTLPSKPPTLTADAHTGRGAGVALLVLTSVLWSLSGVAVKKAQMPPIAFAFYRSVAAALAMAAVAPLARGRWPGWRLMVPCAVVYTAVTALLSTAMTVSTAAAGILLQYTGPVFCALFARLFQGRAIGRRTLVAMVIATAGVVMMIAGQWRAGSTVGAACGLLSGTAFGALILLLEKVERAGADPVNPAAIVLCNNAGAALILLPLVLITSAHATPVQLAIVTATGVVQLAFPYLLFQLALRRVQPVDASLLILLEPVLNPVWVALATSERPDLATLIGGAAILVAMAIEATKKNGK